jgi:hypothetical protein
MGSVSSSEILDTGTVRFGIGEGIAEVFELCTARQKVDRQHIKANGNAVAVVLRNLPKVRCGHAAKRALFVKVDLGLGCGEITGGASLDLEDYESISVPGDEVEVSLDAICPPSTRHDGVTERAEMEVGGVFPSFSGKEVLRPGISAGSAVCQVLENEVKASFCGERELGEAHGERITLMAAKSAPKHCKTAPCAQYNVRGTSLAQEQRYTWMCTPSTTQTTI